MSTDQIPLLDEEDILILMNRDVHFGGNFKIMINYYEDEDHIGINEEFKLDRLKELALIEEHLQENLSDTLLSEPNQQKIKVMQQLYAHFRDSYENDNITHVARLLSDLILTENENPTHEMKALVEKKEESIPLLIKLIESDTFFDHLSPGYGRAPELAARCLEIMQDRVALKPLFTAIRGKNFFQDEAFSRAITSFGNDGKEFLISILKSRPLSYDHEKALITLLRFTPNNKTALEAFSLLKESNLSAQSSLFNYLLLACEGLKEPSLREELINHVSLKKLSSLQKEDLDHIIKSWKN